MAEEFEAAKAKMAADRQAADEKEAAAQAARGSARGSKGGQRKGR